jgi:serine-type D-Ala-D-Ala carboxypeptidase/endopeptidase (penicillin-binding protein 4)
VPTKFMFYPKMLVFLSLGLLGVNPSVAEASRPRIAQSSAPTVCTSNLDRTVSDIAGRYNMQRYQWGFYVQGMNASGPLLNYRGQTHFVPASTTKLLTTAAVLRQLGSQYRLRTSIYRDLGSEPQRPALTIVGRGDPTITTAQLQTLSAQLKQQGIQQIAQLTADTGYFRGDAIDGNWEWGDLVTDYGVPVTSLILQQNAIDLIVTPQQAGQPPSYRWKTPLAGIPWSIDNRAITGPTQSTNTINIHGLFGKSQLLLTGRIPSGSSTTLNLAILDPQDTWLRQFQSTLGNQSINVGRLQLSDKPSSGGTEVAAIESPPLIDLIREINRNSNNLYAEVMLRTLGRTHPNHSTSEASTAELGLEMVERKLSEIGVSTDYYRQVDGSGLSRKNGIAPIALVQTLIGMSKTPEASLYLDTLTSSGIQGTLANRFKAYPGKIRGKTGSFTGTVALAGYAEPAGYERLAFSIVVNNHDRPSAEMRAAIDEIVSTLLKLRSC